MPSTEARRRRSRAVLWAALAALGLAIFWTVSLDKSPAYGWDESMHVALPAARMRLAVAEGHVGQAFDALLDCAQYPFVQPVFLAIAPSNLATTGTDVRHWVILEWAATLVGVFVMVRSLRRTRESTSGASIDSGRGELSAWVAFALAGLSTLSLIYAGTLFLEVPSACIGVWAVVAWLAFWRDPSREHALVAGAFIATAIFVKWNYGLMLGAGLGVDALVRLLPREGRIQRARELSYALLVPVLAFAWWFLVPLPGGFAVGTEHRAAFVGFLTGNTEFEPTGAGLRILSLSCMLTPTPRLFAVAVCGVLAGLWLVRDAAVRTLAIVLVAMWVPVFAHPFFQDRFLVPGGPFFFALAAIGLVALLSRATMRWNARFPRVTGIALALVIALALLPWKGRDAPIDVDTAFVARATGMLGESSAGAASIVHDYQLQELAKRQTLGRGRAVPVAGLEKEEASAVLDLVAKEAHPEDRVGWLGMSSEMSPAMILFGRLERGGTHATFLRDASVTMGDFADPHVDAADVRAFAERFDVVFMTDPPDLKGRSKGVWAATARTMLESGGGWVEREIGTVAIGRPMKPALPVRLIACRRVK